MTNGGSLKAGLAAFLMLDFAAPARCTEPCPGIPPLSCSGPLSVCGQWEAVPQCNPLWPPWQTCTSGTDGWTRALNAVHMVLTYTPADSTARVLAWHGTSDFPNLPPSHQSFMAQLWNPVTYQRTYIAKTDSVNRVEDLFCSSHVVGMDGKVYIVGGEDNNEWQLNNFNIAGIRTVYMYDPTSPGAFQRQSELMFHRRWYPTSTLLPDGRILAVSGQTSGNACCQTGGSILARDPELYKLGQPWVKPATIAAYDSMTLYPFMKLIPGPDVRVLHAGPKYKSGQIQVAKSLETSNPAWQDYVQAGTLYGRVAVVYYATRKNVRILKSGGGPKLIGFPPAFYEGNPNANPPIPPDAAVAAAELIRLSQNAQGQWVVTRQATGSMSVARDHQNLTVLPDGRVLAVGGSKNTRSGTTQCADAVYETEIWDPDTGIWSQVAPMCGFRLRNQPRTYHSTSLLLPDGRVLVAGGVCDSVCNRDASTPGPETGPGGQDNPTCFTADFYKPGYLFTAAGSPISDSDRPRALNVPASIAYGESLSLSIDSNPGSSVGVWKVALIRPSAVTHSNDMEQRYFLLRNLGATPTLNPINVSADSMPTPSLAPPGYYMVFLVNELDHPSIAKFTLLWGVLDATVSYSLNLNEGGTFTVTVTWNTSVAAPDLDELVLIPSGGNPVTVPGTPASPYLSHTLSYTGTCIVRQSWNFYVKSRRPRFTSGSPKSVSVSATKTFWTPYCVN